MMTCKEAAVLISEGKDRPLSIGQRIGLRFHLLACRVCALYRDQLDVISRLSKSAGDMVMGESRATLSQQARERMKERLSSPE